MVVYRNIFIWLLGMIVFTSAASAASMFPNSKRINLSSATIAAGTARPVALTNADFDGDGNPDVAVVDSANNAFFVLLNTAVGGFVKITGVFPNISSYYDGGTTPVSITSGLLNHDSYTDFLMSNSANNRLSLLFSDSNTVFSALAANSLLVGGPGYLPADRYASMATGLSPSDALMGDFNKDGYTDVVAVNANSNTISVWLGTAKNGVGFSAAASYATGLKPVAIVSGDLNGDGFLDFVIINRVGASISVLINNQLGGFLAKVDYPVLKPQSIAIGDVNGDGSLDVVVGTAGSRNISILTGNGAGGFAAAVLANTLGSSAQGIAIADMNKDGRNDIITANSSGEVSILLAAAGGIFTGPSLNFISGNAPSDLVVADFNGDGNLDVVSSNQLGADIYVQYSGGITDTVAPKGIVILATLPSINNTLNTTLPKDMYATMDALYGFIRDGYSELVSDAYSNSVTTRVSYACEDVDTGCQQVQYAINGGAWGRWEKLPQNTYFFTISLPNTEGSQKVDVRFADGSANVSPITSSSIVLDFTAPTGTIKIAGGVKSTNQTIVPVDFLCSDTGGSQCGKLVGIPVDGYSFDSYGNLKAFPVALSAGDGVKTMSFQFKDKAGNISALLTGSILLDTIAPIAPAIQKPSAGFANVLQPVISGTAEPYSTVKLKNGSGFLATVTASNAGLWSYKPAALTTVSNQFSATATDVAGNVGVASPTVSYILDTVPPVLVLQGGSLINLTAGQAFFDPYATVKDNLSVGLTVTRTGVVDIYTAGTYTLTYSATDRAGNAAVAVKRTVTVSDIVPPTIALVGANPLFVGQGRLFTDPGSTVTDNVDVGLSATVTGAVNTVIMGSYTLTYNARDKAGNAAITVARTVTVVDQTPPVIMLNGGNNIAVNIGAIFVDPGSVVTDNVDKVLTATVVGAVNSAVAGAYSLTYSAVDAAGNNAVPVVRTVSVGDGLPPVIRLLGNNPLIWAVGVPFVDPGSTVTDNLSVGLTAVVAGVVNDALPGTYAITYNASDAAGNVSPTVTRTVLVKDLTPPVLTLLGVSPYNVPQGSVFVDPGVTVVDNVDVGLTATVSGTVNTAIAGSYTLNYTSVDAAGNSSTKTRIVNVADTVPPVITLLGVNPYTVAQGSVFTDAGSIVNDNVDKALIAKVTGAVNTAVLAAYTLSYNASDQAGNAAVPVIRIVNVTDQTAPIIVLNGQVSMTTPLGTAFIDPYVTITDNVDTGLSAVIAGVVDYTAVGRYTLTYTATDNAGNAAAVSRFVDVIDQVAPVIALLGNNPYSIDVGSVFVDPGTTVSDNWDTTLLAAVSGVVNTATLGSYTLNYNAVDSAGNVATQVSRIVNVLDRQKPVITLNGSAIMNVAVGSLFSDPGSIVTDNIDSGLTATVSGSVNTALLGQYILNYQAVDLSGNLALTVSRTVHVIDQQPPVISLKGLAIMTVAQGAVFVDPGSSVSDNVGLGLIATVTGTVNTNLIGTYILQYDVRDGSGNAAIAVSRIIHVSDQTAPAITLNGLPSMTVAYDAQLPFIDPGVVVIDNVDLTLSATVKGFVNRASVGNYTLTYEARDAAGNISSRIRSVLVVDQQAPVITLLGTATMTVNVGVILSDPGAIAIDNVDPSLAVTVIGTVNTAVVGQYTLVYHATDSAGNVAVTVNRVVNVVDTVSPVISLLGSNKISLLLGTTFVDAGTVVSDNVDTGLVASVAGTVNTAVAGSYVLIYRAVDAAGNVAKPVQRSVLVTNQTPPLITLIGANPYSMAVAGIWLDPGAQVVDNLNSGLTASVTGFVNALVPGTYVLTYNVVDTKGVPATSVTRRVTVLDQIKPVVSLIGLATSTIAQGTLFIDFGAAVTDNVDIGLLASVSGLVDVAVPGTYILQYSAVDSSGNIALPVTRTVTVVDQSKPVITLLGKNPYSIAQGSVWLDPGVVVTDNVDIALQASVTGVVNTSLLGTYSITYQARDAAGNAASPVSRTVQVSDQTAPIVTAPAAITVVAKDTYSIAITDATVAAFMNGASASDNIGVVGVISHNAPALLPIGINQITFSAVDQAGNVGSASANITVVQAPVLKQGVSTLKFIDVYASPGSVVSLPLSIDPYAGLLVSAFTANIQYDATWLTSGTITSTLPPSWQCNIIKSVPSITGVIGLHIACSTAVPNDALTAITQLNIPFTVASTVVLPATFAVTILKTSVLYDAANIVLPSLLQSGNILVDKKSVQYNLLSGWNLISFPVDMGSTGLADFLLAAPDVKELWRYSAGSWSSYIVALPSFLNSIKGIQPLEGYWVKVAAGKNPLVTISGTPITPSASLQAGQWNLIGVAVVVNDMVVYTANNGASEVWAYNNGNWCSYNSKIPVFLNCLNNMQIETGYYVKMP